MNKSALGKLKASAALLALWAGAGAAFAAGEPAQAAAAPVAPAAALTPAAPKPPVPAPASAAAPLQAQNAAPAAPVAAPPAPAPAAAPALAAVQAPAAPSPAPAPAKAGEPQKPAAQAPAQASGDIEVLLREVSQSAADKSSAVPKLNDKQKIEKTEGANIVASGTQSAQAGVGVVGHNYSSGDIAWILVSTALVLFMITPGVTMFYSGLVRKKNAISIFAQTFIGICIVGLIWVTFGYSLAFRGDGSFIGDLSALFFSGWYPTGPADATGVANGLAGTLPESAYALYQLSFAMITPALVIGAFAERIQFRAIIAFFLAWTVCAYLPIAHWVWSPNGFIATMHGLDWAGGLVVHLNAGVAALVGALILGKRKDFGKEAIIPRSTSTAVAGAGFLLVGWLGFNGGSALAADGKAIWACITTMAAALSGGAAWAALEYQRRKYVSSLGIASGLVAGLVTITPAAGFVGIGSSLLLGAAGAAGAFLFLAAKSKFKFDDALDVFAVHGVPGFIGAILTGALSIASLTPGGTGGSIVAQFAGVFCVLAWSGLVTAVIFAALKKAKWLRVDKEEEEDGCDLADHGEIEL